MPLCEHIFVEGLGQVERECVWHDRDMAYARKLLDLVEGFDANERADQNIRVQALKERTTRIIRVDRDKDCRTLQPTSELRSEARLNCENGMERRMFDREIKDGSTEFASNSA